MKEGESTAIEVPFTASPQPEVRWEHNHRTLRPSKRVTMDSIHNMTSLCIGRAELDDAGTYSLTMENTHGKVSLNIKVIVVGKCLLTKIYMTNTVDTMDVHMWQLKLKK